MEDFSSKLAQKVPTFVPALDELKSVVERGLKKNYREVHAEVVQCPGKGNRLKSNHFLDFSKAPFNMTGSGIGKHLRVAEIGGLGNLYPQLHTEKFFNLKVPLSAYFFTIFRLSVRNVNYQKPLFLVPELGLGIWWVKIRKPWRMPTLLWNRLE